MRIHFGAPSPHFSGGRETPLNGNLNSITWLNHKGEFIQGSLKIENGRICSIFEKLDRQGSQSIPDSAGLIVLPGIIDSHTHFREPGEIYKEGILNGSLAAIFGGVTTVLDMPNNRPPCTTVKQFEKKNLLFKKKCLVNWGLHVQGTQRHFQSRGFPVSVASIKIYSAKSSIQMPIVSESGFLSIFKVFSRVTIHAEDESEFIYSSSATPLPHHKARPKEAINSALRKIEKAYKSLSSQERPRLVICHVSTKEEIEWLKMVKSRGWDIWAETCPHYLCFSIADEQERGSFFKVNPPLRTIEDQNALWEGISDGTIDFISTDHAPHPYQQKSPPRTGPSGIASIEWLGSLLLTFADSGKISWKRYLELTCQNPARCFDIPLRDGVKTGNAADLIFISSKGTFPPKSNIITKSGFNPYEHFTFSRQIQSVMINGSWAMKDKNAVMTQHGRNVYG